MDRARRVTSVARKGSLTITRGVVSQINWMQLQLDAYTRLVSATDGKASAGRESGEVIKAVR